MTTSQLESLAVAIREEHAAAERCINDALRHSRTAGERLIEAKAQVAHGDFMRWVEEHCGFSHSSAELYMRLARGWEKLADSERVANLSLRRAVHLIREAERGERSKEETGWDEGLGARVTLNASNRLMQQVRQFYEGLQGGSLAGDMTMVLTDHSVLDEADVEKVLEHFRECQKVIVVGIEALQRRIDGAQVSWRGPQPSLLGFLPATASDDSCAPTFVGDKHAVHES